MYINKENIKVIVRCRPLLEKEIKEGQTSIINVYSKNQLTLTDKDDKITTFDFEEVFDQNSQQEEIYKSTPFYMVESALKGYNCTILAYGQTGSGKTYTMEGKAEQSKGIIPRTFEHLIETLSNQQFQIEVAHIMFYNERIYDLFKKGQTELKIRESKTKGIYLEDLSQIIITNHQELEEKYKMGKHQLDITQTQMSWSSSRWSTLFKIIITNKSLRTVGTLNLVDLAGSEIRKEKQEFLNCSLSHLGQVVSALADGQSKFVPYRNSKLTRILQEPLGGNSKTLIIGTVSPLNDNRDQTFRTLYFAMKAKKIINKPIVNYFQEQQNQLFEQNHQSQENYSDQNMNFSSNDDISKVNKDEINQFMKQIDELGQTQQQVQYSGSQFPIV